MRKSLEMAKCSSSGLIRGKSYKVKHSFSLSCFCSFLPLFSPLDPNVSWLYIISFNASGLYTWRVGIVFLGYLSHRDLTSRPFTRVLAVQPLFAVTSPSMWPDKWLHCIEFRGDGFCVLPSSSLSCSMPGHSSPSLVFTMFPLSLVLDLPRLGVVLFFKDISQSFNSSKMLFSI